MPLIAARATAVVGVLLVTVAGAVGLAGCSSDEPTPTATVTAPGTTTPAATPTPTPTVAMPTPAPSPTLPVEWVDDGEAGAEEAARYFLELYSYTQSSQDLGPWQAMSHPECVFCQSVVDDVQSRQGEGEVVHAAAITVLSSAVDMLEPTAFSVKMSIESGPDQVWSDSGTLLDPGSVTHDTVTMVMLRVDDTWLVRGVGLEQGT